MLDQLKPSRQMGWTSSVANVGRALLVAFALLGLMAFSHFGLTRASADTYAGKIGVNLEGMNYWIRDYMFVDAMKTSRPWSPLNATWQYGGAPIDTQGWPTADASVLVFDVSPVSGDSFAPDLTGTYHLAFTGQAVVSPTGGCAFTVSGQAYNAASNVTTADIVIPAGQTLLNMAFTSTKRTNASATNTGVTNVTLIQPGYAANTAQVFSTLFLNSLTDFSTLRVMDYVYTNANVPIYPATTTWANRRLKTDSTQSSTIQNGPITDAGTRVGGAWEYVIDLANLTGKDLWINVPIAADDAYVTALANLLKTNLNPNRIVYVEYANEVWNYGNAGFPFDWNRDNAQAHQPTLGGYDGTTNQTMLQRRAYAKRSVEISNLFRSVYGDALMLTTIRPLMAWQAIDPGAINDELTYIVAQYGTPSSYFYAISEATYYASNNTTSLDQIFTDLYASSDNNKNYVGYYQTYANQYGLHHIAYEGGPGLAGSTGMNTLIAANRDARMTGLIVHDVTNVISTGVSLYMYFQLSGPYNQYGCWGLTEDVANTATPKFQAIHQLVGNVAYPTNLLATPGNTQVSLFWTAGQGATSYNIKRSTVTGGAYAAVGSSAVTNYTDTGLTNGVTYYYVVTALGSGGESTPSSEVSATPTTIPGGSHTGGWVCRGIFGSTASYNQIFQAPAVVPSTNYVASVWIRGSGSVMLEILNGVWGAPLTSMRCDATSTWQQFTLPVFNTGSNAHLSFLVQDQYGTAGTVYIDDCFLGVSGGANTLDNPGFESAGASWAMGPVFSVLHQPGSAPPAPPTGVTAGVNGSYISVSWSASTGATSYNLKKSTVDGGPYTTVWNGLATAVLEAGQTAGTTYYFVISALNSAGESADSVQVSATIPIPIPPVPTGLSAVAGTAQVALSWSASTGATSYNVKRATASGGSYATVSSPTPASYTDMGLTNGTTYYYVVSAVDASGESANSSQVSATPIPAPTIPPVPTGLTATPGNAQVLLGWGASAGATSYNVKRSTLSGGPYAVVSNPTANTATSTGLTNGAAYYFVVSAVNSAGESANSSQVSGTPHAPPSPFDINGDGLPDLVLQNSATSQVAFWYLNGATLVGGQYMPATPAAGWKVVGEGDFNGDGKPDLVLQNTSTRQIAIWYLNGPTVIGGQYLASVPASGWSVVCVGDFNGDGKPDLVLQNANSNQVAIWYLNGTTVTSGQYLSATPAIAWKAVASGDFNHDGHPDILLFNWATGELAVWYLNGNTVLSGGYISAKVPSGWKIAGVGDLNGDGKPDLVLQSGTRQIALWYLNGATLVSGIYVLTIPPVNWSVAAPK